MIDSTSASAVRRRNNFLIGAAAGLIWFSMYAYVPILPAYAASLGADAALIGIIGGVYGLLQIALRVPLGIINDRVRQDKILLIAGFGILTISALMFIFGKTTAWVTAARTVAGGAAAWWVILTTAFAAGYGPNEQVKAQGVLSAAANIGKVFSALGCAFVAQAFGYSASFVLSVFGAVVGLALMFLLVKIPAPRMPSPSLREQLALFGNGRLLAFSFLALLSQMLCFAMPTTFTPVAAERAGADNFELGILAVVYYAGVSAGSLFVGSKPYQKLGGIKTAAGAFIIGALSCIPCCYTTVAPIYFMQILSGISYGVTQAEFAGFVIRQVPTSQRGTATGIFQSLFAIGIFLGPIIAGFVVKNVSLDAAYWLYMGISVVAAALCPVLIPRAFDKMV